MYWGLVVICIGMVVMCIAVYIFYAILCIWVLSVSNVRQAGQERQV